MSKHTPGPWAIGQKANFDLHGFMVHGFPVAGAGQAIAAVWAGAVGKEAFGFDNQEANARLIAAAPDMLAALKLCEPFCKGHQETPEKVARYAAVRAAIAKAEGTS